MKNYQTEKQNDNKASQMLENLTKRQDKKWQ